MFREALLIGSVNKNYNEHPLILEEGGKLPFIVINDIHRRSASKN